MHKLLVSRGLWRFLGMCRRFTAPAALCRMRLLCRRCCHDVAVFGVRRSFPANGFSGISFLLTACSKYLWAKEMCLRTVFSSTSFPLPVVSRRHGVPTTPLSPQHFRKMLVVGGLIMYNFRFSYLVKHEPVTFTPRHNDARSESPPEYRRPAHRMRLDDPGRQGDQHLVGPWRRGARVRPQEWFHRFAGGPYPCRRSYS